jgi:DNA-binding winged helix-turn-helix (wHTH) protein
MDAGREARARFAEFELDLRTGELRRRGLLVAVPEQPLRVLELLVRHAGEVVSRDRLRARLWPADTFVDFEHGLNAAVKRLRDILGDAADRPRFVETVPKRGYRSSDSRHVFSFPGAAAGSGFGESRSMPGAARPSGARSKSCRSRGPRAAPTSWTSHGRG